MKPRALLPLAAIAAIAALLLSGPGQAVTRKRAVAAALAALHPKGPVIVYGLPTPLPAGTVVGEAGPTGAVELAGHSQLRAAGRTWKLPHRAWLFWENLAPGAGYVHPSRLVLVDDSTGRVKVSATLSWWPLVSGKPAPFVRRPNDRRYWVFNGTTGTKKAAIARTAARLIPARLPTGARFTGERDCFVYAADLASGTDADGYFQADVAAMKGWADAHKLPGGDANADSAGKLKTQIERLVEAGCNDVIVLLVGHGMPKPGQKVKMPNGETVTAPVGSDVAAVEVSSSTDQSPYVVNDFVTSKDIADIVKGYQVPDPDGKPVSTVHFKLIVDSCFSGRFVDDLAPQQAADANNPDPPIRTIVTSSSSTLLTTLDRWQGGPRTGVPSHWMKEFLDGFRRIEANPNVVSADQGDMASLITDAAHAADDAAQRPGGDTLVKGNKPQIHFAGGMHPTGEPRAPVPLDQLDVRPIQAFFTASLRHTTYTIYAKPDALAYKWVLEPPKNDTKCDNVGKPTSNAEAFVWYHGDDQCSHAAEDAWGHRGVVRVTIWLPGWICRAGIYGTVSGGAADPGRTRPADGPPDGCRPG